LEKFVLEFDCRIFFEQILELCAMNGLIQKLCPEQPIHFA
jgi:hypothetical protein